MEVYKPLQRGGQYQLDASVNIFRLTIIQVSKFTGVKTLTFKA